MLLIPVLRAQSQANLCEFKASLVYTEFWISQGYIVEATSKEEKKEGRKGSTFRRVGHWSGHMGQEAREGWLCIGATEATLGCT